MKKYWLLIVIGISIFSCKSASESKPEFKRNELLIDFDVKYKSLEKLYQIESFKEADYMGIPRKIQSKQIADTLKISFEIFEGNSTRFEGNIDFNQDTITLKIGRGISVKELAVREYQYKIFNPTNKKYKIKIENHLDIKDL